MDPLMANLLDLLAELEGKQIPLIVGGGFGLHLQRQHLARTGEQTLFAVLPEPRSTNDLDLFLRAEVIADLERTRLVKEAISRLNYSPVEEARFMQWKRRIRIGEIDQEVKIDILVGPLGEYRNRCSVSKPRVRPKRRNGALEFHAHAVEEAVAIEVDPIALRVAGKRTNGTEYEGTALIPHAFPYLMMKLHAFDDRKDDEDKDLGRHHALDLYTIVGMMTEGETDLVRNLSKTYAGDKHVSRARQIVAHHFAERTSRGILRLREHPLFRSDFQLDEFIRELEEIFSPPVDEP